MLPASYDRGGITIYQGDCLEVMPTLEAGSVDMILCDLPYGTTVCTWDTIIPFVPLWEQYKRLIKPRGAIVLTAAQPFTSLLVTSNLEWFKYSMVWVKSRPAGFMSAKNKPMSKHEDVLVFSSGTCANRSPNRMPYYPQGTKANNKATRSPRGRGDAKGHRFARPSHQDRYQQKITNFPTTVLEFASEEETCHPTQKPIALFERLILSYTREGATVLDNCLGSGTTARACKNLGRRCIGIELRQDYVDIAIARLAQEAMLLEV